MSLEYDDALDTLSVRDSFCATDKTIYSTIVVASISLIVFYIATQFRCAPTFSVPVRSSSLTLLARSPRSCSYGSEYYTSKSLFPGCRR